MIAAEGAVREVFEAPSTVERAGHAHDDLAQAREAIVRWSGVACLYAGTAAALACLWSPV